MSETSPVKFSGTTVDGMRQYQIEVPSNDCLKTPCPFRGKVRPAITHRTFGLGEGTNAQTQIYCANNQPPFTGCTGSGRYGTGELTTNVIPEKDIATTVPCLGGTLGSNGNGHGESVGSGSLQDRLHAVYSRNGNNEP